MARDGRAYLGSLRDNRSIYIDGRLVSDVTTDPAFANAVASAAKLYDFQADPANVDAMTFRSPTSGKPVNRAWHLPRNHAELVERRQALEQWATLTCGMVGRSPDHVASTLVGFRMGLSAFRAYDQARAKALDDYFTYARDNDLFLSYVIINPQSDKAKSARGQPDEQLVASIVDEDAQGITIRGAKMLATSGVMANELLVSGFQSLQAGDEAYAFTAAVPLSAKGLSLMSRRSYEQNATSTFDYPLSSRFDENDAVVYFEDVKIPWDRVFVCKDLKMAQAQWHETRAHVLHNYQCMIRLTVKLKFLLGLARKIAETNNIINYPQVRETLGLMAAKVNNIEALVVAMEAAGEPFEGYYVPNRTMLCTAGRPDDLSGHRRGHPHAVGRRADHGAVVLCRLRGPQNQRHHPQDPALASRELGGAREAHEARMGCGRIGVRLAPSAIRDVLFGAELRHARERLSVLRLEHREGSRRDLHGLVRSAQPRAEAQAGGGVRRSR
jgi:4-hydroxyphenylacetate 3-monooxygenase